MYEWDDNESPLAYLITFRTYGTWLHGDDRFSVDRHGMNRYGAPKVLPSQNLNRMMGANRVSKEFKLDGHQRAVVASSIKKVCKTRGYALLAVNVRTNHVHCVVRAYTNPQKLTTALKANCTRELRAAGLATDSEQVWARGGSRRYLWKPNQVEGAIDYVLYGQGDDLPDF